MFPNQCILMHNNVVQRNGFYVECGGMDGEFLSNSLFFERERGWKGLLIEADPLNYANLEAKHRKAYTSNTCLATSAEPSIVSEPSSKTFSLWVNPFKYVKMEAKQRKAYTSQTCLATSTEPSIVSQFDKIWNGLTTAEYYPNGVTIRLLFSSCQPIEWAVSTQWWQFVTRDRFERGVFLYETECNQRANQVKGFMPRKGSIPY